MGKMFAGDSPFMRFVDRLGDLLWLNLLVVVTSLPIVTIGAAYTAMDDVLLRIMRGEEGYLTKAYFKAFIGNWKKSTIGWLLALVCFAIVAVDAYLMLRFMEKPQSVVLGILLAGAFLVMLMLLYYFALTARYDNSVRNTIRNSFYLALTKFFVSVSMLLCVIAPFALLYASNYAIPFVLLLGIAGPAYLNSYYFHQLFMKLEKPSDTIMYYDIHANNYSESTRDADVSLLRDRFLAQLPTGARILDLGCGSGRDTKYYLEQGYQVDAADGSAMLCQMASEYTGIKVRQMLYHDLQASDTYDGIWACASLLHVPYEELPAILTKVEAALKRGGIFYASFKYGKEERESDGRLFTDMDEERLAEVSANLRGMRILESWVSEDVRKGRQEEKWMNVLMVRE